MKADVNIPVCACGGTRVRVSTQPVYRCPNCGDIIYNYKGEWRTRGDKSSFSPHKSEPAYHVSTPTVGLAAVAVKPHRKFYLDFPFRKDRPCK